MNRLLAVTQLALCFVLMFCISGSGQNRPSELVGQWIQRVSGYESIYDRELDGNMELFKDGTGVASISGLGNMTISWKVENKRLVILSSLKGLSCNYKLSGYELTLTYDDGKSDIFVRKERWAIMEQQQQQAEQAFERGHDAIGRGDYDKAIAEFTEAIRLNPTAEEAYNLRGLVYLEKKDYDKAVADHTKAIELDPNNADFYSARCWTYTNKGEYDKAISDCNKAIQWDSDCSVFYSNRCWAYANKGEYDKAISDCNKAIQLDSEDDSEDPYPYHSRGFAYLGKKNYDKAIADFEAALRIDPDYKGAKDDLEKAKKLKGGR